jgi:hypothetical protein
MLETVRKLNCALAERTSDACSHSEEIQDGQHDIEGSRKEVALFLYKQMKRV